MNDGMYKLKRVKPGLVHVVYRLTDEVIGWIQKMPRPENRYRATLKGTGQVVARMKKQDDARTILIHTYHTVEDIETRTKGDKRR